MDLGERIHEEVSADVLTTYTIAQPQPVDSLALLYDYAETEWSGDSARYRYDVLKRALDIVASLTGILLLLPIMVFIALLIALDSPGPVIFTQQRIGQNRRRHSNGNGHTRERRTKNLKGQIIRIYKFRTLVKDTDSYAVSPRDDHDERITRAGRWLRATCLDELPQLFNVLKGDLSLVGPRPEMEFIVRNYNPLQTLRLSVKPGITGLWQLHGSRSQFIHENLHHDLNYIKHRSLRLDVIILCQTLKFVFNSANT